MSIPDPQFLTPGKVLPLRPLPQRTFVSRMDLQGHRDQPEWLSHVNASVLKVKLAILCFLRGRQSAFDSPA